MPSRRGTRGHSWLLKKVRAKVSISSPVKLFMQLRNIAEVALYVRDLTVAEEFYTKILGLKVLEKGQIAFNIPEIFSSSLKKARRVSIVQKNYGKTRYQ